LQTELDELQQIADHTEEQQARITELQGLIATKTQQITNK